MKVVNKQKKLKSQHELIIKSYKTITVASSRHLSMLPEARKNSFGWNLTTVTGPP